MDEFVNYLNKARFESTNALWNDLMLNDPWSVGYVSALIEMQTFNNKEEWEEYYYVSGKRRNLELNKLPSHIKEKLNDELLVLRNKNEIAEMSKELKSLNYNYGRTKEQIAIKGNILFQNTIKTGIKITEKECIEAVRFRTICQTWNGIAIRQRNTITTLTRRFPEVDFVSTSGDFDYRYAVDYELKISNELICAIQIKPKSYTGNTSYLLKAKNANTRKNQEYKNQFYKPVFTIISNNKGEINNADVLNQITVLMNKYLQQK